MTVKFSDETVIKYWLVKEVDGVEVRRTEIRPTDHDAETGRFCERADGSGRRRIRTVRKVQCPRCGLRFNMKV